MALIHSARVRLGTIRRERAWRGDIDERLLWVLGSPRSGSTWLLRMLTEHRRIVPVNEPLIGAHLGHMLPNAVDLEVELEALDSESFMVRQLRAENPDEFFAAEYRDVWLPALAEMMRKRFAAQALRHPRNPLDAVLAIQEPNGSQSADVIMAALPGARFVFLLRDGRDVVDSILAASEPDTWATRTFEGLGGIPAIGRARLIELLARKWLWRTEVVERAFAVHKGPKYRLRYEDLRTDTEGQLRSLLDAVGLGVDDATLAAMIEPHTYDRTPAEGLGPKGFRRAATPGLWRENLTAEEQAALERILGPKLRELGYDA
jgi:sulfotransferase family protein